MKRIRSHLPATGVIIGMVALIVGKSEIRRNAVGRSEIVNGAVDGAEVEESTLEKVPAAVRADSAARADRAPQGPTRSEAGPPDSSTRAGR